MPTGSIVPPWTSASRSSSDKPQHRFELRERADAMPRLPAPIVPLARRDVGKVAAAKRARARVGRSAAKTPGWPRRFRAVGSGRMSRRQRAHDAVADGSRHGVETVAMAENESPKARAKPNVVLAESPFAA